MISHVAYSQIIDNGLEKIKSTNLMHTVNILSSAEFDGRLPGSEGYNKAANFASETFEQLGLIPIGKDGYFQHLKVEYNKIDTPAVLQIFMENKKRTYLHGSNFVLRGFTGSANDTLPVAFCGYGISRPDLSYDDYGKINVNGKIVIVFKSNPSWKLNDETWGNELPREKSRVAYEHGAKGIFFVSLPNDKKPQPLIGSVVHGEGEQLENFPQYHISIETANDFLTRTGLLLSECQQRIDDRKAPFSLLLRTNARIQVVAHYKKEADTKNVIGKIEGTDPKLKEEYLVIGAHLDHVGSPAGLLFPGANDNASGSAGLLGLVEAFQHSQLKPKRSVLFALFTSEEQGLFGSKYFVENLNIDTGKIVAMINLDCIGYGDSIQVGNGKSSPELWSLVRKTDKENLNLMVEETWGNGGADATPFHEKGIPCLYFVSKESYDHLHQTTDTAETLNPKTLEEIVKLAYMTAKEIAEGKYIREEVKNIKE